MCPMFTGLDVYLKCVRIKPIILGHGAMAAQRTLNPLIQVRILVPRPAQMNELSKQEENNPDRNSTSPAFGAIHCYARGFIIKQKN